MKNKGKKMFIVLMLLLITCSGILFVPSYEAYAMANDSETVMPMADYLVWKYKTQNGILYKRLYNCSTGKWVGSWIKCK